MGMAVNEVYWTPPGSVVSLLYFVISGTAIAATQGSNIVKWRSPICLSGLHSSFPAALRFYLGIISSTNRSEEPRSVIERTAWKTPNRPRYSSMMYPEGNACRQSVLDATWERCELAVFCYIRYGYSCNTGRQPRQMEESELPIRPAFKVSPSQLLALNIISCTHRSQ